MTKDKDFETNNNILYGIVNDVNKTIDKYIYNPSKHSYLCTETDDLGKCNMFIGAVNFMNEQIVKSLGYEKKDNMNKFIYIIDFTEVKGRDMSLPFNVIKARESQNLTGISGKSIT